MISNAIKKSLISYVCEKNDFAAIYLTI